MVLMNESGVDGWRKYLTMDGVALRRLIDCKRTTAVGRSWVWVDGGGWCKRARVHTHAALPHRYEFAWESVFTHSLRSWFASILVVTVISGVHVLNAHLATKHTARATATGRKHASTQARKPTEPCDHENQRRSVNVDSAFAETLNLRRYRYRNPPS